MGVAHKESVDKAEGTLKDIILHSPNKESNMMSKVVPVISYFFVFVNGQRPPTTDKGCFTQEKPSTFEAAPNSTFEVRIEHEGDIVTDWFTNGDLYTLKLNEAKKVNASTLSVHNVCVYYNTELGDSKLCKDSVDGSGLNDPGELWLVYNGKTVCGGMLKKDINITNVDDDQIPPPVISGCNYICMNATLDAPDIKFTYYDWNINMGNKNHNFQDTLVVKAGSSIVLGSVFVTLLFSVFTKLV